MPRAETLALCEVQVFSRALSKPLDNGVLLQSHELLMPQDSRPLPAPRMDHAAVFVPAQPALPQWPKGAMIIWGGTRRFTRPDDAEPSKNLLGDLW